MKDYRHFLKLKEEQEGGPDKGPAMFMIPFERDDIVFENKDEIVIGLYPEEIEALYECIKNRLHS